MDIEEFYQKKSIETRLADVVLVERQKNAVVQIPSIITGMCLLDRLKRKKIRIRIRKTSKNNQ